MKRRMNADALFVRAPSPTVRHNDSGKRRGERRLDTATERSHSDLPQAGVSIPPDAGTLAGGSMIRRPFLSRRFPLTGAPAGYKLYRTVRYRKTEPQ